MYTTINYADYKSMESDLVEHIRNGWKVRYYAFVKDTQYLAVLHKEMDFRSE